MSPGLGISTESNVKGSQAKPQILNSELLESKNAHR